MTVGAHDYRHRTAQCNYYHHCKLCTWSKLSLVKLTAFDFAPAYFIADLIIFEILKKWSYFPSYL